MTKSAKHKREVRKEKTKIKLKISQKDAKRKKNGGLLPKGLNVTDTSFKTRKILIHENLRPDSAGVPTTVRKQTFKELLGHLNHFSASVRQDGINGLKELLTRHPELVQTNLSSIFDKVTQQVLDRESEIRKSAIKLLENVFKLVDEDQVSPFFPLMIAQLTCSMTHILPAIQQSSLEFLDVLLTALPKLMSTVALRVLPSFLEQISRQNSDNTAQKKRVLTIDPSRRLTTLKWRQQVLERTSKLLELLITDYTTETENCTDQIVYDGNPCYAALFSNNSLRLNLTIPVPGQAVSHESCGKNPIQVFISTLVPLVMDTWVEAITSEQLSNETEGSLVSVQTAELLNCIVNVLLLSLQLLQQQSTDSKEMVEWFKSSYGDEISRHFLHRFPYSSHTAKRNGKAKDKSTDQDCRSQNINLCYIWASLNLSTQTPQFNRTLVSFLSSLITSAQTTPLTSLEVDRLVHVFSVLISRPNPGPSPNKVLKDVVDFLQKVRSTRKDRLHLARSFINLALELPSAVLERVTPLRNWIQNCPQLLVDADTSTLKCINVMMSRSASATVRHQGVQEALKLFKKTSDFNKNSQFLRELLNLMYWTCRSVDSSEAREIVAMVTESIHQFPTELQSYAQGVLTLL